MTLKTKEDVQKICSPNNGIGYLESITDENWQETFQGLRYFTEPTKHKELSLLNNTSKVTGRRWGLTDKKHITSQYTYYENFINDILQQIQLGKHDFCYHIYQIAELLKFHKEKLKTKLSDGYIEVWLEN